MTEINTIEYYSLEEAELKKLKRDLRRIDPKTQFRQIMQECKIKPNVEQYSEVDDIYKSVMWPRLDMKAKEDATL